MYWDKSLFCLGVQNILFFVALGSFFVFVSFSFLVYVEKFNLQWAEMPSCKSIGCINGAGKTADKISYFPFSNPKN